MQIESILGLLFHLQPVPESSAPIKHCQARLSVSQSGNNLLQPSGPYNSVTTAASLIPQILTPNTFLSNPHQLYTHCYTHTCTTTGALCTCRLLVAEIVTIRLLHLGKFQDLEHSKRLFPRKGRSLTQAT